MTLKIDWIDGEYLPADAVNDIAKQVNKHEARFGYLESGSAGVTPPGFAVAHGRTVLTAQELGVARADATAPAGEKPLILGEAHGSGVLEQVWFAANGGDMTRDSFVEDGGRIRVYLDNNTVPAIDLSINDFFMYGPRGGEFSTPSVGRTKRGFDSGQASAYRNLFAPFSRYMRVEMINKTSSDLGAVYGHVKFRYDNAPRAFQTYKVASVKNDAFPARGKLTVVDIDGSGQLEHLYLSVSSAQDFEATFLEGNVQIFVDGELIAAVMASGTEDFFTGGWYAMPEGGYPAGRAPDTDITAGTHQTMYRFFTADPIRFNSHVKVVMPIGQYNQGTMTPATLKVSASAGMWLDDKPDRAPVPQTMRNVVLLEDNLDYPIGTVPTDLWTQPPDRTQAVCTGTTISFPTAATEPGQDMRIARKYVFLPENYWVETKMRIRGEFNDLSAGLMVSGSGTDGYFGGATHVSLVRASVNNWQVKAFDGFDQPFVMNIGDGTDLTDTWVWLAMRVEGSKRTAFFRFDGATDWHPVGSFTTSHNEQIFGLYSWQSYAEFDQLNAYAVDIN
ncbi:DUF2961 domain-containing protein [Mycolicibacterium palauense]|uniref:DUF2961 domain-containing protein n=1 Tax=Mycolicibacterium palauense TaxID=2034511 RepID=UPI000BFEC34B|nr:DUF2961 domain-containing protein [Mycolicibacterium palauense]